MAEALVEVADPLGTILGLGERAPIAQVVQTIEGAVAPSEADVSPPAWLRSDQVVPYRRALATLDRYGAALLADPVGSGKSYIALAVARQLHAVGQAVAVVPAAIAAQWQRTAQRLGVDLVTHTHERLSRGRLPDVRARLVIVDESHRFRHPGIRRYRELARWCIGRRVLLLTATPVVNRLEDLGHQLLLGLRSDALAADGVPDLLAHLIRGESHAAFGRVVLCRPAPADRPDAQRYTRGWVSPPAYDEILSALGRLTLSTNRGVAALIRVTLLRSLASSLVALKRALRRYLSLLDHSRLAAGSGRQATRSQIRQFSSAGLEQLVLWEMLPDADGAADLVPDDGPCIVELLDRISAIEDPRLDDIAALTADRVPTIVFTASRDTLRALRDRMRGSELAWICGNGAGIGTLRLPAARVLDCFRPGQTTGRPPHVLLATDVAAEGLDLQRAERIVHFDLPWTPMRLDQREGRAVRLGNAAANVAVITYARWPALEARIGEAQRLLRKRATIDAVGVSDQSHWLFRWRSAFSSATPSAPCWTIVAGRSAGWLIAVAIDRLAPTGERRALPADLLWIPDEGAMTASPEMTTPRLAEAATAGESPFGMMEGRGLARLSEWIRLRLREGDSGQWRGGAIDGPQRRLMQRLQLTGRRAAQQRNRSLVNQVQQAVEWLSGGLSAGELLMVDELLTLEPVELMDSLHRLAVPPRVRHTLVPRLCGAVRFIIPP